MDKVDQFCIYLINYTNGVDKLDKYNECYQFIQNSWHQGILFGFFVAAGISICLALAYFLRKEQ